MAQVVGTIKEVTGLVGIMKPGGPLVGAKVGDRVEENDVVQTLAPDATLVLELDGGRQIVLGGNEQVLVDQSVFAAVDEGQTIDADALQQALANGIDLDELEATAAGEELTGDSVEPGTIIVRGDARGDVEAGLRGTEFGSGEVQFAADGGGNLPPDAVDDEGTAVEEGSGDPGQYDAPVPATGNLLANDSDDNLPNPPGDLDVIDIVSDDTANATMTDGSGNFIIIGKYGTLTVNAESGEYSYVIDDGNPAVDALNIGDTLEESFTYTISDGVLSDSATLSITLNGSNDAPVAVADGVGYEVAYDSDAALTDISGAPTEGAAVKYIVDADAGETVTFSWHFNATDYMPYNDFAFVAVDDGPLQLLSNIATTGNYGSAAGTYSITFTDGGAHTVTFGTANYGDTAMDPYLTVTYGDGGTIVDVVTLGQVVQAGDAWSLTAAGASVGALNNFLDTSMSVGDLLIAMEGNETDPEVPAAGNVLANDYDVDNDHGALTVVSVDGQDISQSEGVSTAIYGQYGMLLIAADGSFTYTPYSADSGQPNAALVDGLNYGDSLSETFTYTVSDNEAGGAKTDAATLMVLVHGTNDAPVAVDDFNSVTESGPDVPFPCSCWCEASFPFLVMDGQGGFSFYPAAMGNVITGEGEPDTLPDSDVDNTTLTVTEISYGNVTQSIPDGDGEPGWTEIAGTYGVLHIYSDGHYEYLLNNNAPNVQELGDNDTVYDVFTYTLSDNEAGGAKTDTADLTIEINGTNDYPCIFPIEQSVDVPENIVMPDGQVQIADVDAFDYEDGGNLTYSISGGNDDGLFQIDPETGQIYLVKPVSYEEPTLNLGLGENSTDSYSLTVTATDSGGLSANAYVGVNITNVAPLIADPEILTRGPAGEVYAIDPDKPLDIQVTWLAEDAGYRNSYGYYFADANGNPISGALVYADTSDDADPQPQMISLTPDQIPDNAAYLGFFLASNAFSLNDGLYDGMTVYFGTEEYPGQSMGTVDDPGSGEVWAMFSDAGLQNIIETAEHPGAGGAPQSNSGGLFFSDVGLNPMVGAAPGQGFDADHEIEGYYEGVPAYIWEDLAKHSHSDTYDLWVQNGVVQVESELIGTDGHDEMFGSWASDIITGLAGNDLIVGFGGSDLIDGGAGDDLIIGGSGADTLVGGAGDDRFVFDAEDTLIDGGEGHDSVILIGSGDSISFANMGNLANIEVIDMKASGHTLESISDDLVASMTDDGNKLMILGDSGLDPSANNSVQLNGAEWSAPTLQSEDGVTFNVYTGDNGAELWVDTDVNVDIIP